jgi:hypothetical protein
MSDEAPPSSTSGSRESASPAPFELEPLALTPLVPPPAVAAQTAATPAPPPPTAIARAASRREREAAKQERKRRLGTSLGTSIVIHVVVFAVLFLLIPLPHDAPPETPVRVTVRLRDWHFLGEDPESDGTGPRGPGPNVPPPEPPKGRDVASGFLDDDRSTSANAGVGRAPAGSAFAGRVDGKEGLVAAVGGDGATEGAVHMALDWLARHQEKDGTWNARRYVKLCPGEVCDGACEEEYATATTALALLPFLGAGHTFRDGPWKDVVRRGLTALHDRQLPDGRFDGGQKRVYADALATLAVSEAYGLTRSEPIGDMARRAVAFWVRTQNDYGGWRYEPGDREGDSSVTGWVAMALASAKKAGIDVPDKTLSRCGGWYRAHTDADGVVGYTAMGTGSKSLLGVGFLVRVMTGTSPDDPALSATAARLEAAMPRWPASDADLGTAFGVADPMHWYYGAMAAFQRGGTTWKMWNERLRPLLLDHQEKRGCAAGSWPPVGETGAKGGRVVVTALGALTLEVYYRYPRVTSAVR